MKRLNYLALLTGSAFLLAACGGTQVQEPEAMEDDTHQEAMMEEVMEDPEVAVMGEDESEGSMESEAAEEEGGESSADPETSEPIVLEEATPEETADPVEPVAEVKTFTMTAKQWEFIPSTITVNQGDTVRLVVTSVDVDHGLSIPQFGVNERLVPDQTVTVEFVADKAGSYSFFCNVLCGSGHGGMRGKLIVQ